MLESFEFSILNRIRFGSGFVSGCETKSFKSFSGTLLKLWNINFVGLWGGMYLWEVCICAIWEPLFWNNQSAFRADVPGISSFISSSTEHHQASCHWVDLLLNCPSETSLCSYHACSHFPGLVSYTDSKWWGLVKSEEGLDIPGGQLVRWANSTVCWDNPS